jgi:hypothetical protein
LVFRALGEFVELMTENNGGYRIDAGRIVAASFVSRQDRDLKV